MAQNRSIIFVTSIPCMFQYELQEAFRSNGYGEYTTICSSSSQQERNSHWFKWINEQGDNVALIAPPSASHRKLGAWFSSKIERIKPSCIIIGGRGHNLSALAKKEAQQRHIPFGFWMEPPNMTRNPLLLKLYIKTYIKWMLHGSRLVMGIGDRAVHCYKSAFSGPVELLPYGQDLSYNYSIDRPSHDHHCPVTFTFSGQMVERHNIDLIAKAILILYSKYPAGFHFILAGYGPLVPLFWEITKINSDIKNIISVDTQYDTWTDRLRPFAKSDALVYPSNHSGWGLVIPEAMASGCIPITTLNVEAARFYVKHEINGFFINPCIEELVACMSWCIENRNKLDIMSKNARLAAQGGDAKVIAKKLVEYLESVGL